MRIERSDARNTLSPGSQHPAGKKGSEVRRELREVDRAKYRAFWPESGIGNSSLRFKLSPYKPSPEDSRLKLPLSCHIFENYVYVAAAVPKLCVFAITCLDNSCWSLLKLCLPNLVRLVHRQMGFDMINGP